MAMPKINWEEIWSKLGYESEGVMWDDLYLKRKMGCPEITEYFYKSKKNINISHYSIYSRIKKLGYKMWPRGGAPGNRVNDKSIGAFLIKNKEQWATMTLREISNKYGFKYHTIHYYLYNLKIPYIKRRPKPKCLPS